MHLPLWEFIAIVLLAGAVAVIAVTLAFVTRRQHARMTALNAECESVKTLLEACDLAGQPASGHSDAPAVDHHVDLLRTTFLELANARELRLDPADSEELRLLALRHETLQSELQMLRGEIDPGAGQMRIQEAIETLFGGAAGAIGAPWADFRKSFREALRIIMRGVATAPARERLVDLESLCARVDELIGVTPGDWDIPVAFDPDLPSTEVRTLLESLHTSLQAPDDSYDHAGGRLAEMEKTLTALDAAIERLEQAPAPEPAPDAGSGDAQHQDELKELIMQFTRDSRDMLNCIAELEVENERLREKLEINGIAADDDSPAASAEDTAVRPEAAEAEPA